MSIILDALKKAEEKKKGAPSSESPTSGKDQKRFSFKDLVVKIPKNKRPFLIFAAVIGFILGGLIFWGTSDQSPPVRHTTSVEAPSQIQNRVAQTKMEGEQKKIMSLPL